MADWGSGILYAGWTVGPTVCWLGQWMAALCGALSLAYGQLAASSEIVKHFRSRGLMQAAKYQVPDFTFTL